jgi:hypothetical protein
MVVDFQHDHTSHFFLLFGLNSISAAKAKHEGELSSVRPTDILSRKSQPDFTVSSSHSATHKKAWTIYPVNKKKKKKKKCETNLNKIAQ